MNLVTGATGLLGSHIVEQLVRRGMAVRSLVRASTDRSWLETQGVEIVAGDVTDRGSLDRACQGVSCVFHAAARVGDWGPWDEFVRVTIDGTRNLIGAAEAAGVKRFIHVSSISVYGHVDGDGLVLDETAPLGANLYRWSYYSRAKVAAERLVWQAHREGRIQATVIRPSWLYGPRDRATIGRMVRLIRQNKAKLIGDGQNRLNVTYAGNVAEAAVLASTTDRAIGEAYNCSNDGILTQLQYLNMMAESLGAPPVTKKVPYKVAHAAAFVLECIGRLCRFRNPPMVTRYAVWLIGRRCFFETNKAREHLNWQPRVTYEEGIPLTIRWYREQESRGAGLR